MARAAPVQHAVLAGDDFTGATTFHLEAGMDTGPVFGTVVEPIGPRDTSGQLLERLSAVGAELLRATIDGLAAGRLVGVPQSADGVLTRPNSPPTTPGWIGQCRRCASTGKCGPAPRLPGLDDFSGPTASLGPVLPMAADPLPPGQLLVEPEQVLVGTATQPVRLGEVQPAGKRSMPATDWARGLRRGSAVEMFQ